MREIGSEFWDVPTTQKEHGLFPTRVQWFLSGRCGLHSIIKELEDCHTVAMPSWCCDSMIKPFVDVGKEVYFYPVFWEHELVQEPSLDCDVLFLMDYFGYTSNEINLTDFEGVVIRDITHSVFSKLYSDADYYFGTLRKWAGIWTGGYAWASDGHSLPVDSSDGGTYVPLRSLAMQQKAEYLSGAGGSKGYLALFEQAEEALEHAGATPAAGRDILLARRLDTEKICKRRRDNAKVLREAFPDWLIFPKLSPADTPMFVPVLVPGGKRDALRSYLIEREIYCPVHWPVGKNHSLDARERFLYDNALSLVCDQRYDTADMTRMVETICAFWRIR